MPFETDQTAVIVPVPDAERRVRRWRQRFDTAAAFGVPAHVTLVFPFVRWPALAGDDRRDLRRWAADCPPIVLELARTDTFAGSPGVLHLPPTDPAPFVRLTDALVRRWPEAPPYGGAFGLTPVPHLTVTETAAGAADQAAAVRDLAPHLPLVTTFDRAVLLRFDGERWVAVEPLPFRGWIPQRS